MDKLLPCPFCGGEATLKTTRKSDGQISYDSSYVLCLDCRSTGLSFTKYYDVSQHPEQEAIAAWNRRAQPENEPLTLEQMREMDGEPVWVHRLEDNQGWWVVIKSTERDKVTTDYGGYFEFADYGKTWLAYRRPPEMFISVDLASGHDFTAYGRPPERSENE